MALLGKLHWGQGLDSSFILQSLNWTDSLEENICRNPALATCHKKWKWKHALLQVHMWKEGTRKGVRWETERQRGNTRACAWDGEWVLLGALWNGKLESFEPVDEWVVWLLTSRGCWRGCKFGEKDYNSILRILTLKMPKKIHQVDCWVCKSGTKSRAYAFSPFPLSHCGIFVTHLLCIIMKMLFLPISCFCTLLHKWHQCWALGVLFVYFLPWSFLSRFLTRFMVSVFVCLFVCLFVFTYFALFLFKFSFVRFPHRENSSLILSSFENIFF